MNAVDCNCKNLALIIAASDQSLAFGRRQSSVFNNGSKCHFIDQVKGILVPGEASEHFVLFNDLLTDYQHCLGFTLISDAYFNRYETALVFKLTKSSNTFAESLSERQVILEATFLRVFGIELYYAC